MTISQRGGRHRAGAPTGWRPIGLPPETRAEEITAPIQPPKNRRSGRALTTSVRAVAGAFIGLITAVGMMSSAAAQPADGMLPSLPDSSTMSLPTIDGSTDENVWTPGSPASTPDGPTYFGTLSDDASPGQALPDGGHVYLADPAARNFNGSTGGWSAYQEYSPNCFVRGVTCVNWNFAHETGGQDGPDDAFLRVNGTSFGVAPCTPNNGVARWVSPKFTYLTASAESWKLNFDHRQTEVLFGEGHSTFNIQILDDAGRVVTTAHGPEATFPLNQWQSVETGFDGSKLVYGKDYRISIMVDVVHAETALSWGNLDFDNISMTATPGDGPAPVTICQVGDDQAAAMGGLLSGRQQDFCPLTNQLGQGAAPLLDAAAEVMNTDPMDDLLDKGSGAFAVADLESGQFVGYMFGKESIPSTDPRNMLVYLKDGTAGEAGNFAVMFVMNTVTDPMMLLDDPAYNVQTITAGQLGNATDLLADPGRVFRIPVDWQADNAKFLVETILNPMVATSERDTALGGVVWSDENRNGAFDQGEPVVEGVDVTLTDANDNDYGTQTTGDDGRYLFDDLEPRSDPSSYFLTFDEGSLPAGTSFTTQHAPGTVHGTTSHADEETGRTDRITLSRYQRDLRWNAGVMPGDTASGAPGTDSDGVVSITVGAPTVNGTAAGSGPGPEVPAGSEITISIPVTNDGEVPVTGLGGDTSLGELTCSPDPLQPGDTATCTLTTTAQPGENTLTVNFTAIGENGEQSSTGCKVNYVGVSCSCARENSIDGEQLGELSQLVG